MFAAFNFSRFFAHLRTSRLASGSLQARLGVPRLSPGSLQARFGPKLRTFSHMFAHFRLFSRIFTDSGSLQARFRLAWGSPGSLQARLLASGQSFARCVFSSILALSLASGLLQARLGVPRLASGSLQARFGVKFSTFSNMFAHFRVFSALFRPASSTLQVRFKLLSEQQVIIWLEKVYKLSTS
jgi:hypothetical protein